MRGILLILFLFFFYSGFSQPGTVDVVSIEGKTYYKHVVKEGNTLWSLQQLYKVPVQEIVDANPGVEDGLKVGQIVNVPKKNVESTDVETSNYTVKKKETLYGISKKFNTTVEKLIELNPELSEGLKKDQIIKVPGKIEREGENHDEVPNPFVNDNQNDIEDSSSTSSVTFEDSVISHIVMEHETMYSISKRFMVPIKKIKEVNNLRSSSLRKGQVLIIPVKREGESEAPIKDVPDDYNPDSSDPLNFENKNEYKIAILLPLHIEYGPDYSEYISKIATQFYTGAKYALDSLEKLGLNAKVYIHDTRNDSMVVKELLLNPEMPRMDLIIGPLLENNIYQVADFCKRYKIRMVCPVTVKPKVLKDNRLVYACVPSNITMMRGLARYMLDNCKGGNVIVVKPTDKASIPLYEAYIDAFKQLEVEGARPKLIESTVDGFNTYLTRNSKNHIVVPTMNKLFAAKFMNNINRSSFRAKPDQISVYGTKSWINFHDIHNGFKNKYNLHVPTTTFVDYYTDEMIRLNKTYRDEYNTDFSKVAIQAFDVLMHFSSDFFMEGNRIKSLMNSFDLNKVSESDGYENKTVYILKQEDFELVMVGQVSGQ